LIREIGQGFFEELLFELVRFVGGEESDRDPDVVVDHEDDSLKPDRELLIGQEVALLVRKVKDLIRDA
jgi:hypothetical protein